MQGATNKVGLSIDKLRHEGRSGGRSLFSVIHLVGRIARRCSRLPRIGGLLILNHDRGGMSAGSPSIAVRPSERCCAANCCAPSHAASRPIVARYVRTGAPNPPLLSAEAAMCKAQETTLRRYPRMSAGRD